MRIHHGRKRVKPEMKKIRWMLVLALVFLCAASCALAACDGEHSYSSWVTKRTATCTRQGHQFKYCRNCDHWEQRYTKKLPHTIEEWYVVKEPTCREDGVMGAHCTVCGGYIRKTVDKLGHDWETVSTTKEPTCNKEGKGDQVCSRCGKTRSGVIPKLEHQWSEWTVIREPSGKKRGSREHVCQLCGKKETELFHREGSLYEGMKGSNEEVIALQTMLKDLGYYKGKINSGKFGAVTGEAVGKFQKAHRITVSNVADPDTLESIRSAWETKTGRSASELIPEKKTEE